MKTAIINIILLISILFISSCNNNPFINDENAGWEIDPPMYPVSYRDVSVSPDGNKLIFLHLSFTYISKFGYETNYIPGSRGIWTCNIDGTDMKQIYKNDKDILDLPQYMPSMDEVIFVKNTQICKARLEDGIIKEKNIIQLTNEGKNIYPSISPDGQWITYSSNKDIVGYRIWKMNKNGQEKTKLVNGRMPHWGIDNNIYYIGLYTEIYKINNSMFEDSIKITDLNNTDIYAFYNRYPKLSKDLNVIAFTSQLSDQKRPQIIKYDFISQNISLLTNEGVNGNCSFTNDNKIVYVNYEPYNYHVNNGTIWIMDIDGNNKKQITYNDKLVLDE